MKSPKKNAMCEVVGLFLLKFNLSRTAQLRRFKLEMNWNQEELEQWAIAARQKEEDSGAVRRGNVVLKSDRQ